VAVNDVSWLVLAAVSFVVMRLFVAACDRLR
jgi:hypothetical protein